MNFSALIARFKNDLHTPVAIFVFLVTTAVHVLTHKDIGPQYTNSLYAFYAFLGGHAFTTIKYSSDSQGTASSDSGAADAKDTISNS